MNRRQWLQQAGVAATIAAVGGRIAQGALATARVDPKQWKIGVCNRAWMAFELEEALAGARDAGFTEFGFIATQKGRQVIAAKASRGYLDEVKSKMSDHGLNLSVAAVRFDENAELAELTESLRRQIDHTAHLGGKFVMTFGADKPANYAKFEKAMTDASAHAAEHKVKMVVKPHGGISSGPDDILRLVERVGHPNFSVWYDPGNVIYYTGGDPVAAYPPIARFITGMCAKDCGKPKGEVMITFGEGKVDFPALFRTMETAGFDGPIIIEGIRVGPTAAATTANAKANRLVLERAIATITAGR